MESVGSEPFPPIYVDSKVEGEVRQSYGLFTVVRLLLTVQRWAEVSQSQFKKVKKLFAANQRKKEKSREKQVSAYTWESYYISLLCYQEEDAKKREENLEKAKSILIEEDSSLPPAQKVPQFLLCSLAITAPLAYSPPNRSRSERGRATGTKG